MALEEPETSRFETSPSGPAGGVQGRESVPDAPAQPAPGAAGAPAIDAGGLQVPPEILEAVLVTASTGEGVETRLEALRAAVQDFAVGAGATDDRIRTSVLEALSMLRMRYSWLRES